MSFNDEDQVIKADLVEDALDRIAGAERDNEQKKEKKQYMVHIQYQQRTTRKGNTLIQGLADDLDFKKLLRHFKKLWNCNGTVINDEEFGQVIQLSGDNRRVVAKFLMDEGLATK